jgi:septin family protein
MKNLKSLDQHLNEKSTYIKRMEGLVNRNQLNSMFDAADGIIGDMLDDGFEMDEVAEFIKLKIDQYLASRP